MPPLLDSKTEYYISTTAHRASLSRQHKATERSKSATSSCRTDHRLPHLPEIYRMPITDTSVFRTSNGGPYHSHDSSVALTILLSKKPSKWSRIYYDNREEGLKHLNIHVHIRGFSFISNFFFPLWCNLPMSIACLQSRFTLEKVSG